MLRLKKISLVLFAVLISHMSYADKVKLLLTDEDALQARVDIIQQARKEILVEYFSVWNDEQSVGGFMLLQKAAQSGIKVKVIMDSLSNTVPRALISALQMDSKGPDGQQNLEIKVYNPLNLNLMKATHRDHAKMLIVDSQIMISGGRNVGDKYFGFSKSRNFKDTDLILSGDAVNVARENYFKVWKSGLTEAPKLYENSPDRLAENTCAYSDDNYDACERLRETAVKAYKLEISRIDDIFRKMMSFSNDTTGLITNFGKDWTATMTEADHVEFMSHEPEKLVTSKTNTMTKKMTEKILRAKREVLITSPYLIPTAGLHEIFENLISRGVKVRIITNSLRSTDNLFAQAGYRAEKQKMTETGIEIYEYNGPDTLHAKTALIDQETALVGTFNLDPRSMHINREVGFAVTGNDEVNRGLSARFESLVKESTLVAKDKVSYNTDKEFEGISDAKKLLLKAVTLILPLIKNQI
jgi:putative cardiolipin synthase